MYVSLKSELEFCEVIVSFKRKRSFRDSKINSLLQYVLHIFIDVVRFVSASWAVFSLRPCVTSISSDVQMWRFRSE